MNSLSTHIGKKVEQARKQLNIKQGDFAKLIDLSRASVVNIEKGRQNTTVENLYAIAHVTGKPISFFLPSMEWNGETHSVKVETVIPVSILRRLEEVPQEMLKAFLTQYRAIKKIKNV